MAFPRVFRRNRTALIVVAFTFVIGVKFFLSVLTVQGRMKSTPDPTPAVNNTIEDQNTGTYDLVPNRGMSFKNRASILFCEHVRQQIKCGHMPRIGPMEDGGYYACMACGLNWKPNSCLVYSLGIGGMWDFEDEVAQKYGCTVRAYDPSINTPKHTRKPNIHFWPHGLGGKDYQMENGWKIRTLKTLMEDNGDIGKVIDYLKADIELAEWDTIEQALKDGIMDKVKQLAVEFHYFTADDITRGQQLTPIRDQLLKMVDIKRYLDHK